MELETTVATAKLPTFPTLSSYNEHHFCLHFYVLTIIAEILRMTHRPISTFFASKVLQQI
jgi:hypothetical protein